MANIKTAISIEKPLFKEVEELADELDISRSQVFSLAVKDYLKRRKNQRLLEAINAAYADFPDEEEKELLTRMKSIHHRLTKDSWK